MTDTFEKISEMRAFRNGLLVLLIIFSYSLLLFLPALFLTKNGKIARKNNLKSYAIYCSPMLAVISLLSLFYLFFYFIWGCKFFFTVIQDTIPYKLHSWKAQRNLDRINKRVIKLAKNSWNFYTPNDNYYINIEINIPENNETDYRIANKFTTNQFIIILFNKLKTLIEAGTQHNNKHINKLRYKFNSLVYNYVSSQYKNNIPRVYSEDDRRYVVDDNNRNILHFSGLFGYIDLFKLTKNDSSKESLLYWKELQRKDSFGFYPSDYAAINGHVSILDLPSRKRGRYELYTLIYYYLNKIYLISKVNYRDIESYKDLIRNVKKLQEDHSIYPEKSVPDIQQLEQVKDFTRLVKEFLPLDDRSPILTRQHIDLLLLRLAKAKHWNLVAGLVKYGANITCLSDDNNSIFTYASISNTPEIILWTIRELGVYNNHIITLIRHLINTNTEGYNILIDSCEGECPEVLALLNDKLFDCNTSRLFWIPNKSICDILKFNKAEQIFIANEHFGNIDSQYNHMHSIAIRGMMMLPLLYNNEHPQANVLFDKAINYLFHIDSLKRNNQLERSKSIHIFEHNLLQLERYCFNLKRSLSSTCFFDDNFPYPLFTILYRIHKELLPSHKKNHGNASLFTASDSFTTSESYVVRCTRV